jgi:hypothetical protein
VWASGARHFHIIRIRYRVGPRFLARCVVCEDEVPDVSGSRRPGISSQFDDGVCHPFTPIFGGRISALIPHFLTILVRTIILEPEFANDARKHGV